MANALDIDELKAGLAAAIERIAAFDARPI